MNPECVQRRTLEPTREWAAPGRTRGGAAPQRAGAFVLVCLVALAMAAGPGCSTRRQGPTPEQRAAAQRAQEEKEAAERIAAEQEALAKKAQEEEAKRTKAIEDAKLPPEFGTPSVLAPAGGEAAANAAGAPGAPDEVSAAAAPKVATIAPVLVPQKLPPTQVPGAKPYDEAFPPIPDRVVRIGIMSGSSQAPSAQNLARMLSGEDRKYMEETLGLGVKIAYVSETDRPEIRRTRVRYRQQFLRAAVHIAALLPQPQQLGAMSDAEAERHGVDVLVQIGTELQ